ncbi:MULTISPECIES: 3-deoxy-manno-octulosonate cytidylyltransferase [Campylobacter]|uniref:3-deoxy-manno-octulosonate cytidylyltransferase n=1 Tax=Campylobacter TaxID=194 RepID=UPI000A32B78C|nr:MULTISPECIES: 3-deoxy-manno-octulosonate cytidylyltransferase [unclassified Campylobacter]MCR8695840.1 3-deoxy-manno-octulosonate cytidylyltransferase [Campylobacter sp. RM19073]
MIIIPARLASTRFANKILADIGGIPMFIKTAKLASKCDDVAIACDDEAIAQIATKFGIKAIMTSKDHNSGTDRINEAAKKLNLNSDDIVINLQADEPFFEEKNLIKFKDFTAQRIKDGAFMTSCLKFTSHEEAKNPNLVKVITDKDDYAIYFSRSLIPYPRSRCDLYKAHIGIYGYSVDTLAQFCSLTTKELENIEKLEQLRALSSGKNIAMLEINSSSIGIDTIEDLQAAANKFGFTSTLLR